jgi:RNA polymerase sigma-70 factor (ECF subfamily)
LCTELLRRRGVITADARGDWHELAERLRPFIARRLASPGEVDDVLQDVLLRMHRGLADLADEQVARNTVIDHNRKRDRGSASPLPDAPDDGEREEDIDVGHQLSHYLAFFVARLPSPYREAITLVELEGVSQVDACRMLDISLSGMKSRVQRGRAKLREMLEACCEFGLDARRRVIACRPRPHAEIPDGCCPMGCDDDGADAAAQRRLGPR